MVLIDLMAKDRNKICAYVYVINLRVSVCITMVEIPLCSTLNSREFNPLDA